MRLPVSKGDSHIVRDATKQYECAYIFEEQTVKLFLAVTQAQSITRIDDPDKRISLFEVVSPVGAKCPLTTHIPYESFRQQEKK